jgi:ADP-ribosyl-[dinitrogen reductase] hydrolase
MNERQHLLFDWDDFRQRPSLNELLHDPQFNLRRGVIFDIEPDALDMEQLVRERRIEGMLWGVAVGDALGHSTEFKYDPTTRHERFGTILDHLSHGDDRVGSISDDAQMTFWTVESLLEHGRFEFDQLARKFVERREWIVGRGTNTNDSLLRHRRRLHGEALSILECVGNPKQEGRGNGALMRFAPLILPHVRAPSRQLWEDCVLSALITHGNTVALSASVAMTGLLWEQLKHNQAQDDAAEGWLDKYLTLAGDLENERLPMPLNTDPIPKWYDGFRGTLCDFLDGPVRKNFRRGVELRDACSLGGFGSRADCTQTVPAVLYILMCHSDSFESAMIAAVNDTKDNDTTAAIVGALMGARHGLSAIRRRWIAGIRSDCLHGKPRSTSVEAVTHNGEDRELIDRLVSQAVQRFCDSRKSQISD